MASPSRFDHLATRYAPLLEQLHALCDHHNLPFGSPADLPLLVQRTAPPGPLHDDFTALLRSAAQSEGQPIPRAELLEVVALAIGGPDVENAAQDLHAPMRDLLVLITAARPRVEPTLASPTPASPTAASPTRTAAPSAPEAAVQPPHEPAASPTATSNTASRTTRTPPFAAPGKGAWPPAISAATRHPLLRSPFVWLGGVLLVGVGAASLLHHDTAVHPQTASAAPIASTTPAATATDSPLADAETAALTPASNTQASEATQDLQATETTEPGPGLRSHRSEPAAAGRPIILGHPTPGTPVVVATLGPATPYTPDLPAAPSERADRASRTRIDAPPPTRGIGVVSSGIMSGHLLDAPQPDYPKFARFAHIQGRVVLQAVVSRNGSVISTRVLQGHHLLRGAAEHAVRRWRYRPYTVDGRPVDVGTIVTLDFRLPH